MNLSFHFFFHLLHTLYQLPLTFFTTQLKSTSTRTLLSGCHHQTNFQLFYNYCPTFFCAQAYILVNGSSDFSDTFLVECSQLLSSFEKHPFFWEEQLLCSAPTNTRIFLHSTKRNGLEKAPSEFGAFLFNLTGLTEKIYKGKQGLFAGFLIGL